MVKKTPEPMRDEVLVTVLSALGAYMGTFLWHKDNLELIDKLDKESKHCHLHYVSK